MEKPQFRWLASNCEARSGRRLEQNSIYEAGDFPVAVVAQWVKTGVAEIVVAGKKPHKEGD